MGLLSALSNAVSGLNINQQNLNVLSQNISNANTPNYSHEVVNQAAAFINGQGVGVSLHDITRTVDAFLTAEVQGQTSINSAASTVQGYYSQIENLLGTPGTTNSLDQGINSFFAAAQSLANSPNVSSETSLVNTGVALASKISGLASSLQGLRLQADSDIKSAVQSINSDLQTLASTNAALERAAATKQPTGGLLDQRDTALADIAQYIDIKPTYQDDGEVSLNTSNGLALLSPSNSSVLSYQPVNSVQSLVGNANISPIQIQTLDTNGVPIGKPVPLATGGTSSSVTTSLVSGKIQGLLSVRDGIIPDILSQLDQMASSLRDGVNAVTNAGTSFPPPNSYTGTRALQASSATQYSGSVQVGLLDANGNPVTSPYADELNGLAPLTLNLGALQGSGGTGVLSTDNIINAINQYYGPPQNKAEIGNINNVQLGIVSNNIPDTGNKLNFDFNLGNLSANNASFFVTGVTVLNSSNAVIASSAGGGVTSTQASTKLASYTASNSNTITVATSVTNTFTNGETVYLNIGSTTVNGTPLASGYYTVSNVSGNNFDITVPGVTAGGATVAAAGTDIAQPPVTTVNSGQTARTGNAGTFSVSGLSSSEPYYTVQANIGTVDATGNVITSTITYRVPNNAANVQNNLVGASSATAGATIVSPATTQPLVTASLVDANGNPLSKTNGVYGNQTGFLKITANNSSYTLAINELDSKQLGMPNATIPQPGTNQGFSQYFGLNNFFKVNNLTSTGDTATNSAINLSVEDRIRNNPGLVSIGALALGTQPSAPGSTPNFTYILAPGDNSISQKLAALATASRSFAAAGGMPPSSTTLSQYTGQIIAKASSDSNSATNSATDSQTLLTGFTTRAQSVSGVNLDQELANTVIYQNSYAASTRVISVVSTMFQELLGIIQ